jgi:hypothetical protein
MIKTKTTKLEACKEWVREFNAIPSSLLERAFKNNIDDWCELTKPTVGDRVWSDEHQDTCEVVAIDIENETATIDVDGEEQEVKLNDITKEYDGWLPMWGTLWTFGESMDEYWVRENLEIVSQCGFRVFEDQETGDIYLGIDGGGYDFYESHWLPLYEARGLKWHDEQEGE